jgi:hypothetical protein
MLACSTNYFWAGYFLHKPSLIYEYHHRSNSTCTLCARSFQCIGSMLAGKKEEWFGRRTLFLSELRAILNQIDPIDVAEAAEWTNIQHARVYLHRLTAKQSSSVK